MINDGIRLILKDKTEYMGIISKYRSNPIYENLSSQCKDLLMEDYLEKSNGLTSSTFIIDSFPLNDYEHSLEILEPKPLDIDTQISNIKHQLKYEKNPLIIKNLNRKMNKLIKEKKNDSRRNERKN